MPGCLVILYIHVHIIFIKHCKLEPLGHMFLYYVYKSTKDVMIFACVGLWTYEAYQGIFIFGTKSMGTILLSKCRQYLIMFRGLLYRPILLY